MPRPYVVERRPLQTAALLAELGSSPLIGPSPLRGTFEASRGFAITFKDTERGALCKRFSCLDAYLARVLAPGLRFKLGALPGMRGPQRPNLFYLNILVVPPGAAIEPHVDVTLRERTGIPTLVPQWVSVAYLRVPNTGGGALVLADGPRYLARLEPRLGRVLHFAGHLRHGVERVEPGAGESRISLVCECYRVPKDVLATFGSYEVRSFAGFGAHLEAQRARH